MKRVLISILLEIVVCISMSAQDEYIKCILNDNDEFVIEGSDKDYYVIEQNDSNANTLMNYMIDKIKTLKETSVSFFIDDYNVEETIDGGFDISINGNSRTFYRTIDKKIERIHLSFTQTIKIKNGKIRLNIPSLELGYYCYYDNLGMPINAFASIDKFKWTYKQLIQNGPGVSYKKDKIWFRDITLKTCNAIMNEFVMETSNSNLCIKPVVLESPDQILMNVNKFGSMSFPNSIDAQIISFPNFTKEDLLKLMTEKVWPSITEYKKMFGSSDNYISSCSGYESFNTGSEVLTINFTCYYKIDDESVTMLPISLESFEINGKQVNPVVYLIRTGMVHNGELSSKSKVVDSFNHRMNIYNNAPIWHLIQETASIQKERNDVW